MNFMLLVHSEMARNISSMNCNNDLGEPEITKKFIMYLHTETIINRSKTPFRSGSNNFCKYCLRALCNYLI